MAPKTSWFGNWIGSWVGKWFGRISGAPAPTVPPVVVMTITAVNPGSVFSGRSPYGVGSWVGPYGAYRSAAPSIGFVAERSDGRFVVEGG